MQLLIIDDHPGIRRLIAEAAAPFMSDIREFACFEQVLVHSASLDPRCATVDLRMNGVDGIHALRELRAMFPKARLIMVTQFDLPPIRSRALAAGADEFISKERLSDLPTALERAIQSLEHRHV